MERYLAQLWATPSLPKPEGKKLKKRNQKVCTQPPTQRPYSVSYSDTKAVPEYKAQRSSVYFNIFGNPKSSAPSQPPLPRLTDSGHGGWLVDIREKGYVCRGERLPCQLDNGKTRERPSSVVPEFTHLATASEEPSTFQEVTASPSVNNGTCQARRRYAKTPVLHIGQLEAHSVQCTQSMSQDVPSTESIAESYKALLESRNPYMSEATVEHPIVAADSSESSETQDSNLTASIEPAIDTPELPRTRKSPRSDDGTLVASEEDSTDFKNVPASLTPSSPSRPSQGVVPAGPEGENVTSTHTSDLKICLDLLTKELLSTFNGSPSQSVTDTSAFQIYLMIEAYEKLRDQVLEMREAGVNDATLKVIFDTWLKALHSIHEGMAGADGQGSESHYESNYGD
ncbi:hypothetical protein GGS21DRAFT_41111 [Xylaria nigripes]|nr:hypothetical protein GGS21DRAFT_41111 [Xylaria nigripes]